MTDRTTINVSKDAHRAAKEAKKDGESWSDYIQRCINEADSTQGEPMQSIDTSELARDIVKQLDYAAIADSTAQNVLEELR